MIKNDIPNTDAQIFIISLITRHIHDPDLLIFKGLYNLCNYTNGVPPCNGPYTDKMDANIDSVHDILKISFSKFISYDNPQFFYSLPSNLHHNIINKLSDYKYRSHQHHVSYYMGTLLDENDIDALFDLYQKRCTVIEIVNKGIIYNMMEYLMTRISLSMLASLVSNLGFTKLIGTIDIFYNLLWYFYDDKSKYTNLNFDETHYISGLNSEELLTLLPDSYKYDNTPKDKASLLYAIVSGNAIDTINTSKERYGEIIQYPPSVIWKLAQLRYNVIEYIDNGDIILCNYTPYQIVASHYKDDIENIFLAATDANINNLIIRYGIVISQNIEPNLLLNAFLEQIVDYQYVFTRSPAILLPPPRISNIISDPQLILRQYTTKELVDTYNPTNNWYSRDNLISNIINESGLSQSH